MLNYVFEQMGESPLAPVETAHDKALAYVRDHRGARTFRIADHLGVKTKEARQIMAQLEYEHRVHRDPHSSAVNDIFWQIGEGRAL